MRLHPTRRIDVSRGAKATGAARPFVAVREQHTDLPARPRCSGEIWHGTVFKCQRGRRTGMECASCEHYLSLTPDRDLRGATVRCLFVDDDPVSALMTPVERLVTVDAAAPMPEAAAIARASAVRQVLAMRGEDVVALWEPERHLRIAPIATVPAEMRLSALARLFRTTGLAVVLVMAADQVAGLITAGDLLRARVPGIIASIPSAG